MDGSFTDCVNEADVAREMARVLILPEMLTGFPRTAID
jgi:hypothetical protein